MVGNVWEGVVKLVIQLSALGLKSDSLIEFVTAVAAGKEPSASLGVGQPKPVRIQLHSFLHDPRQYGDLYGIPAARAAELRALLKAEPETARDEVAQVVSGSPRLLASGRAVEVILNGMPGTTDNGASPLAGASAVTASYAREIASNSGVYGAYKFEAFDTRREETQRFAVDLGGNFFVLAQSKKLAIMVARIASVKGRDDPLAHPYVVYVDRSNKCIGSGDVPPNTWMCRRGPRDNPPSPSTRFPSPELAHGGVAVGGDNKAGSSGATVVGESPPARPKA